MLKIVCLVITMSVSAGKAFGADICEAVALHDVGAEYDPENIIKKGDLDTGISQYNVNKRTGRVTLCSHGGSCYPLKIRVNGQEVEALRLTNCSVGARIKSPIEDEYMRELSPVRSMIDSNRMRGDDVDNALLKAGVCSACAANASRVFVRTPRSPCGRLTAAALKGSKQAMNILVDGGGTCQEESARIP